MESVTLIILIATVAFSIYAWSDASLLYKFMFNPYSIEHDKQYYRLITSGFIHADWTHLLFNMFTFYSFGSVLEYYYTDIFGHIYGPLLYLLLYFIGIALSDAYSFISHRGNKAFNSLGASGAVASVIYSCILFFPLDTIYVFFIPMPGFIYAVLYLIYCSYAPTQQFGRNVNHNAHLWGSIIGVVYTVIIYPAVVPNFFYQVANWRF